jgi:Reverse transcriptase (RNA-dependent DNA polymerase)
LEATILSRIKAHAADNNIFIDEQFGFRQNHCTTQQLLRVTSIISDGFNKNRSTGIVYLDVAKAFDRVWHDGLLSKLSQMKFPPYLINLLDSYLSKRTFSVNVNGTASTIRPILAGVPQGSIIGPAMFNLFTNDIPTDYKNVQMALYADDAAIISTSFAPKLMGTYLQPALDGLSDWYAKNRIMINISKTNATFYTQKRNLTPPTITMSGEDIVWAPSSKYLGVVLDSKLKYNEHVDKVASKANNKVGALRPLLCSKSMPLKSKLQLIQAIIVPTLSYASPIWSCCQPYLIQKLQRVQNRAMKAVLGVASYTRTASIHKQLGQPYLHTILQGQNEHFYASLKDHENALVSSLDHICDLSFDKYPRPTHSLRVQARCEAKAE